MPVRDVGARTESPLTSRGQERRDELVRFATAKFAQQGYHPTSVAELVDGIGVGKGVFYWYFASKEDLLREILNDALLDVRRHQQAAIRSESNPIRRIELGVRASLEWLQQHAEVMRLVDFAWTEDTFAADLRKGRAISIEDTARHLREAMDMGMIEPADPVTLAIAVRGITEEVARVNADAANPTVPVEDVVRMVISGITGKTAIDRERDPVR
ncbi:MAG: TetR/AcrR family transcriptional regulator [Acidimicrobiales bacterium]|nr:TetR/AcrR family transcriptional regulator [Acidimicrobiales bacterium]